MIGDRWGVTADEMRAAYPCDRYVPEPTLQAWRAVTIDAPVDVVWSWLVQVRLAPYSYDLIDNLGRRSPRTLLHLDDPEVGDPFSSTAGRPVGRVLGLEHQAHLTARIMGTVLSYQLRPAGHGRTRLTLKFVGDVPRLLAPALALGDLVMARRQLLNLKKCAEMSHAA
jgi:hypothetical protein